MSENSAESNPIIVFSCRNCGVIVGDSLNLVCTNAAMHIVTISGGHKLRRDQQKVTSNDAFDADSTYCPVHCHSCNFKLGRYYLTTSRALSDFLDNYTLEVSNLSTYELGTVTTGDPLPTTNPQQAGPVVDQQEELIRVQHVLVDLAVRLRKVEAELAEYKGQSSLSHSSAAIVQASSHQPEHTRQYQEKSSRRDGSRERQSADDSYRVADSPSLVLSSSGSASYNDSGAKRPRR